MSKTNKYLIVSLPTSITPSRDQGEAFKSLRSTLQPTNHGDSTYPFTVPTFKIGTLDALVQQADELTKLSSDANVVVGKVGDSLGALLEGDAEKIKQQKVVGDSTFSSPTMCRRCAVGKGDSDWENRYFRPGVTTIADSRRKALLAV